MTTVRINLSTGGWAFVTSTCAFWCRVGAVVEMWVQAVTNNKENTLVFQAKFIEWRFIAIRCSTFAVSARITLHGE
ncbi:hypothetical protein M378DRAFT_573362 [Amanita muscaria Koide BX008]|uniref:Uncharacterized protein n=1 Tax=Amanita muscaria (strain Koide BX008) TaxID=946122 RepID=A0A0C2SND1_AMAMK|nr:hypothetical protein M378DRAFT_573362 [Amanita muscaria Koide BX008]